jgi:hypothetical protein
MQSLDHMRVGSVTFSAYRKNSSLMNGGNSVSPGNETSAHAMYVGGRGTMPKVSVE